MKLKEILLTVIAVCTIVSAYFSYSSYKTLDAIAGGNAQATQSKETITKKYAKKQTYAKAQETGKPMVVFFYADWCGYCKRFAPVFHSVVKKREFKKNLAVAYVNCDAPDNTALVKEYGIQGFPTVYMVSKDGTKTVVNNSELFAPDAKETLLAKFLKFAQ